MELNILTQKAEEKGKKSLPKQFNEDIRPDLIARSVLTLQANKRQPYGASKEAGKRSSSNLSKRRRKYRGTYGIGQSRTPRKVLTRRGTRMYYVGAFAPQTVGGRRAHPPKAEKILGKKVNKKENKKAIRSALAATTKTSLVKDRGHMPPEKYPFIIDNSFESLSKTKDIKTALIALGLKDELTRSSKKTIRAGKGKTRGRKYRKKKGILLVVSKDCSLNKAARNIPGIDIAPVNSLNTELLAPGAIPGRLTLFTEAALDKLDKDKLFM
ncbi:50S ribosomal protein L4 [Candidatus Woesearchaeota archaeon]|nr:50S ribosomal protein L4 [Candidatus Woesearchaeota archaeon]